MNRVIYACEFPDGYAYVGLTCDPELRKATHGRTEKYNTSAVALHKKDSGLDFEFKILTDYIPEEDAVIMEKEWMNMYEAIGWNMLNRVTGGGIGGKSHKFDDWRLECDPVTGNYFGDYEFETIEVLDEVYSRPSYCSEELSKMMDCCNEYVFLGHRFVRISREMFDRWYVFGFVLEEYCVVRRVMFHAILHHLMNSNVSYKSVGKKLKKEMETVCFLLKPSVLYELIDVSGQDELERLLNAETLEQSLTIEQRKSINKFMKGLRQIGHGICRFVDELVEKHQDEEFVCTGLKYYREKEKGSRW